MTTVLPPPPQEFTAPSGLLIGQILSQQNVTSSEVTTDRFRSFSLRQLEFTTSGLPVPSPEPIEQPHAASASAGSLIAELRQLSGLTWEQLARLCKVSRRTLHFWASGKPMKPGHQEHLNRLLGVIRYMDRGTAELNRAALLSPTTDEKLPFDLLSNNEYALVEQSIGKGVIRPRPPTVSPAMLASRKPIHPTEILESRQERLHPASGRLLKSKPIRLARSK